jgi:predicted  nucleic acid-binding Zn-ribbon protein
VIPEEDKALRGRLSPESERDVLAERRARRSLVGEPAHIPAPATATDPALVRRAEAAEATVRTLEAHLADLRRRQVEAEHERESAAAQLVERDRELRRVKQREHAEQQLRVEAEETTERLRRGHRAELDRLQRRAEEAHAAAQHAEEQRAALAARLAGVSESCVRLERGVAALQSAAIELRIALERDHEAAQSRIGKLESALARATAESHAESEDAVRSQDVVRPEDAGRPEGILRPEDAFRSGDAGPPEDVVRREEMAGALAAAVERLRARVAGAGAEPDGQRVTEAPIAQTTPQAPRADPHPPEVPTVIVVPRLFSSPGRRALRLAPAVRRVAARLTEWADRAQDRAR